MATTLIRILLGGSLGLVLFAGISLGAEPAEVADMVMIQQEAIIAD
jgi:hypothetical protein